ncbi:unnamed protein product, partial [Symbiodinium microadriaticum]
MFLFFSAPDPTQGCPVLAEWGGVWRADNRRLQAETQGITFRGSKCLEDKVDKVLSWNSTVHADDEGDGWVKVNVLGYQVIAQECDRLLGHPPWHQLRASLLRAGACEAHMCMVTLCDSCETFFFLGTASHPRGEGKFFRAMTGSTVPPLSGNEYDVAADGSEAVSAESSPDGPVVDRLGYWIKSMDGRSLGTVVADAKKFWKLNDGKVVQKAAVGKKWSWSDQPPVQLSTPGARTSFSSSSPSPVLVPLPSPAMSPKASSPSSRATRSRIGSAIAGVGGASWGRVLAEDAKSWLLDSGRRAKKASENVQWRWEDAVSTQDGTTGSWTLPPAVEFEAVEVEPSSEWDDYPQAMLINSCSFLSLKSATASLSACKRWAQALRGRFPVELPPPQVDKLLQFCLLQVLLVFDETRLPLPITAVYSEMRSAGRRATAEPAARSRLESMVLQPAGPSYRAQQSDFLGSFSDGRRQRHHVCWLPDVKSSGFKSLDKMARHFHATDLIE